eukprot:gene260-biopygen8963
MIRDTEIKEDECLFDFCITYHDASSSRILKENATTATRYVMETRDIMDVEWCGGNGVISAHSISMIRTSNSEENLWADVEIWFVSSCSKFSSFYFSPASYRPSACITRGVLWASGRGDEYTYPRVPFISVYPLSLA